MNDEVLSIVEMLRAVYTRPDYSVGVTNEYLWVRHSSGKGADISLERLDWPYSDSDIVDEIELRLHCAEI